MFDWLGPPDPRTNCGVPVPVPQTMLTLVATLGTGGVPVWTFRGSEVGAAQSTLATAQADVRTREAEVNRARESVKLAGIALSRERATFGQNIANRREVSQARSTVENARNALVKARQTLEVASAAYAREKRILSQNLNNIAQVQAAQSTYNAARAELKAARTALALFKSSPNGSASVPVRAPMAGVPGSGADRTFTTICTTSPSIGNSC